LDILHPFCSFKNVGWFKQTSYSRWAVAELLNFILENRSVDPIVTINWFIFKMNKYSNINEKTKPIFLTAKQVAWDFLEIFAAMK
jgi:hypothetical protein